MDSLERAQARQIVTGAVVACLVLVAFVGLALLEQRQATAGVDGEVEQWFAAHAWTTPARVVSFLGLQGIASAALAGCVFLYLRKAWQTLVGFALVPILAWFSDDALKGVFQRERPHLFAPLSPGDWGFPSGHATLSAAFFTFSLLLGWRYLTRPGRVTLTLAALAFTLLVGWSRMALDKHFLTDIVGGYLLGLLVALTVWLGTSLWSRRPS